MFETVESGDTGGGSTFCFFTAVGSTSKTSGPPFSPQQDRQIGAVYIGEAPRWQPGDGGASFRRTMLEFS